MSESTVIILFLIRIFRCREQRLLLISYYNMQMRIRESCWNTIRVSVANLSLDRISCDINKHIENALHTDGRKHSHKDARTHLKKPFHSCWTLLLINPKFNKRPTDKQLESVAKISNLQYIEVLQSYGNPIYWSVAILW